MKFVLTITGPSASGKSTLERALANTGVFRRVVSDTTRPMRRGEVDGKDYHFVNKASFKMMLENGRYVESVKFAEHYYGVRKDELLLPIKRQSAAVVVVDPDGASMIKGFCRENGIPHLALFLGIEEQEMISRFILRDPPSNKEQADKMALRLMKAVHFESKWKLLPRWDMTIDRFDENNQQHLVDLLVSHAQEASAA